MNLAMSLRRLKCGSQYLPPQSSAPVRRAECMKPPKRLVPLIDEGLIDAVSRQLMSGKEAIVYVVRCGDDVRCAKVYKEANQRSFHQAVAYQEGRRVKNSRPCDRSS